MALDPPGDYQQASASIWDVVAMGLTEVLFLFIVLPIFLLILFIYPLLIITPLMLYGGLWGFLALIKLAFDREPKNAE